MRTISKQTTGRADRASGWSLRSMRFTKVFGGILFFALLHNPVQALSAIVQPPPGQSVTVAWNQSTNPAVTGHNVYYGGASGAYTNVINAGNGKNATISGLTVGTTYYFATTTYDSLGLQSPYSSEAAYTVTLLAGVQFRVTPAGQFILTVTGPVGHTYDIQATQDFITWTVIGTATVGSSGSLDFTDTNAASFSKRFYRTRG